MNEPDKSSTSNTDQDDHPPSAPMIEVELYNIYNLLAESTRQQIESLAARALALLPNHGQLRVSIVDDQRMSIAHEKFSGIIGTTDVLTFDLAPQTNNYDQKIIDADLTICYDQASRQADEHNHSVERELLLYIIHGTLHCLGYNDHKDDDYQRMHNKEDELLTQIGVGPTFFTDQQHTNQSKTETQS